MDQGPEKLDKLSTPSVAIDGSRIRTIREAKKLTQLYVASVVGVTTDTISRWENNRYPSIKRDNAEKLAGALEVELVDILRQEEEPDIAVPVSEVPGRWRYWLLVPAAAAIVITVAAFFLIRRLPSVPTAVRWVPHLAAPGEIIPVEIKVTQRQDEVGGFILKEKMPAGFRIIGAIPPSSAPDSTGSVIKWLVPGGKSPLVISYSIQVPATMQAGKEARLDGEIVVRKNGSTRTETVSGSKTIRIGGYHWADGNGDGRIDDDEIMPAYYVCEAMKGLGLDWKTIEAIWSGKGYRWDAQHGFTVVK